MPPTAAAVRQKAGLLIAEHQQPVSIGEHWVRNFISRNPTLKSKYNRKYDYQRAQYEDPELIRGWFQRVQRTKAECGFIDKDTYNFDETGFQIGVILTAKVITGTDRGGRPRTTQPGNREWVTVIEAIYTRGFSIPPLVIFEAVMHQAAWYEDRLIPPDWSIGMSENSWTTNEIGLY